MAITDMTATEELIWSHDKHYVDSSALLRGISLACERLESEWMTHTTQGDVKPLRTPTRSFSHILHSPNHTPIA